MITRTTDFIRSCFIELIGVDRCVKCGHRIRPGTNWTRYQGLLVHRACLYEIQFPPDER